MISAAKVAYITYYNMVKSYENKNISTLLT